MQIPRSLFPRMLQTSLSGSAEQSLVKRTILAVLALVGTSAVVIAVMSLVLVGAVKAFVPAPKGSADTAPTLSSAKAPGAKAPKIKNDRGSRSTPITPTPTDE